MDTFVCYADQKYREEEPRAMLPMSWTIVNNADVPGKPHKMKDGSASVSATTFVRNPAVSSQQVKYWFILCRPASKSVISGPQPSSPALLPEDVFREKGD